MKVVLNDGTEIPVYVPDIPTILENGYIFLQFIPYNVIDLDLAEKIYRSKAEDEMGLKHKWGKE